MPMWKENMSHISNCGLLINGNCPDLEYDKMYIVEQYQNKSRYSDILKIILKDEKY